MPRENFPFTGEISRFYVNYITGPSVQAIESIRHVDVRIDIKKSRWDYQPTQIFSVLFSCSLGHQFLA